jgi:hypothetical protein
LSTIDPIISTIEGLPIDGGVLTLKAGDFNGDFMASVFSQLLVAQSITFSGATRTPGTETITVSGSADVLGYTGLPCTLTFDVQDNEAVGTLVGTFAKTRTITLPLITWIKLGNITLSTSISETSELVGLDFKMDILLDNGDVIPVELQRQSSTEWRLDIAEGTNQGITGQDIVALLGGEALESFVPEPLSKILEGFKINDIETILDTTQKTVSYFSLGVSVTNGWDIAPKVSLQPGLQVGLTLINPTDKDSRVTAGNLSATFDLAGVIVPITIGATIGSVSSWTFGLQPGQSVTLPSFSDLLALAGGDDFLATLPSGLSKIPKIDIDKLMVEFEPANKALTLLSFSLQTDSSWPVIANYFEIQKLKIAFDITNLTDPKTRAVLGDLYALFLVDKIALMCEIKKTQENPDWTITAGLAPGQTLNFTNIVTGLFEGKIDPPDDVPQIVFDVLAITVIPGKSSFEFKAGSNSDWWIIAGKLSIASFDLDFTRVGADSSSAITGHIATTLALKASNIQLNLKASLNDTPGGGWQFSGSTGTAPIPIGTLIGDLVSMFGDVTLPPILTGLSVSNVAVTFNTTSKDFTFTCTLQDSDLPDLTVIVDIVITNGGANKTFSGTAQYKSTKFVLDFGVKFVEQTDPKSKTTTTIATYNAATPPTLSDFLEFVGTELGFDADFPKELNLDADLKSLTLQLVSKDKDPLRIEAAGLFDLTFGSGKPWDLYLSYTNDSYFASEGSSSRAQDSAGKPAYIFGISFSGILDLTQLPLVGSIPGVGDFNIDKLGFYYTDAAFTATDSKLIFGVAELGTKTPLAPDPASAFLSQPSFSLMALFGDQKNTSTAPNVMPLGTATSTPPAKTPPAFASKQADPRKPISWLSINKTIGPVELSKVGLGYESPAKGDKGELGIVGIYFDGAFSIAGLTMVLDRLGITFPVPTPGGTIDNPLSKVGFHLGGMFLEYKAPDIEIAGGFINLPGGSVNMIGEFVVEAGPYGLQAYGGYADTLGHPSLFIFLHLNAPIGGPPFFFINGVSGGFGVNRGFKLPSYSELSTYPLLPTNPSIPTAQGLDGKSNAEKLEAMTQSLLSLADYFPVEDGEYWFAVGLDISSFEMIEVSAILSIAFGVNLQIGVIGSASMTLPVKEPEPIAYVQINFEVSYSSDDGLLAVMGAITPASFIYAGLVHLSGGFAFYTWLSGEHSGDFVLTIGGYNSHYTPPAYYPNVPRMEMRAGIGIVNMVGQAYFALLPHALMAGIDIKATADLGPISAWFYAGVDFYLGWKPFHYEAQAAIEIGASFTIDLGFVKSKITIHVGVQLNIWGPSFGGTARVDLDIISFTISFGAAPAPAPALDWTQFQAFLPSVPAPKTQVREAMAVERSAEAAAAADADKPLVNILVKSGLVKEFPPGQEVDGLNWIVDANHFDIRTHSTAPCTQLVYNGTTLPADYDYLEPGDLRQQIEQHTGQEPPYFVYKTPEGETDWYKLQFGIPPMSLTDIASTHTVTLQKLPINAPTNVTDVIVTLTTGGVPPSLWGNEPVSTKSPPSADSTVIKNALIGLQFTPMLYFPLRTTFIPYYYLVFDTNDLFLAQDTAPQINPAEFDNTAQIYASMQDGTIFGKTEAVRSTIADTLKSLGFDTLELVNSGALSTQDYVDDPELTYMSSTNETVFS